MPRKREGSEKTRLGTKKKRVDTIGVKRNRKAMITSEIAVGRRPD
jgi:hypothetical protein